MQNTPDSLTTLGYQARREERLRDASDLFSEAVRLSREASDQEALARSLTGLGQIERDLGKSSAALRNYEEAASIYRSLSDELRLAHTVRHIGDIHRHDGSLGQAERCYEEALRIYRGHQDETPPLDMANALRGMALLKTTAGETEEAKLLWHKARTLYESEGVQAGVQESDAQLARLARK